MISEFFAKWYSFGIFGYLGATCHLDEEGNCLSSLSNWAAEAIAHQHMGEGIHAVAVFVRAFDAHQSSPIGNTVTWWLP